MFYYTSLLANYQGLQFFFRWLINLGLKQWRHPKAENDNDSWAKILRMCRLLTYTVCHTVLIFLRTAM